MRAAGSNAEALELTRRTGYMTFFSRSRQTLWLKGETSGNRLAVKRILADCDEDSVVVRVARLGDGNGYFGRVVQSLVVEKR